MPKLASHPLVDEIFKLARRRGMTMVELAKRSGVDRKTIYSIHRQNKNAGLLTLTKLGTGLGLELKWSAKP